MISFDTVEVVAVFFIHSKQVHVIKQHLQSQGRSQVGKFNNVSSVEGSTLQREKVVSACQSKDQSSPVVLQTLVGIAVRCSVSVSCFDFYHCPRSLC